MMLLYFAYSIFNGFPIKLNPYKVFIAIEEIISFLNTIKAYPLNFLFFFSKIAWISPKGINKKKRLVFNSKVVIFSFKLFKYNVSF